MGQWSSNGLKGSSSQPQIGFVNTEQPSFETRNQPSLGCVGNMIPYGGIPIDVNPKSVRSKAKYIGLTPALGNSNSTIRRLS